jgi:ankyrin repeat protein
MNCTNNLGWTALHHATNSRLPSPEVVDMLLRQVADTEAKTTDGRTPMHILADKAASGWGQQEISERYVAIIRKRGLLSNHGGDMKARCESGQTLFSISAQS